MKKLVIIALCFMASFKANTQVIDTTIKGCFAAPLKTNFIFSGENFKQDTATHFAFIQDATTFDDWNVTVSLRTKTQNLRLVTLALKRKDFDDWDGYYESLLRLLLSKFNNVYKTNLSF